MKKKLVALGLVSLLGLSGLQASAMPHQDMHGCRGHRGHAQVRVAPPHHVHAVRPGISFSTGVLARRSYWNPYYYYGYPIGYEPFYMDCRYPSFYIGVGF